MWDSIISGNKQPLGLRQQVLGLATGLVYNSSFTDDLNQDRLYSATCIQPLKFEKVMQVPGVKTHYDESRSD